MTKKIRTKAFESIHSSAEALLKIGAIDMATMREFDEVCMAEVPAEISDSEESPALRAGPQNHQ
ncbi:DNA-binding protein [Pseudomonas sp. FP198]|jgi:putative transcriptional regulator|uniref:DNA-binding protein n=1 Tax=Pseudomonas sp. FP198 TaxID=2954084 RepID=UPI002737071D|nr:DNA-binding protein [Pseudomonas sp. FP198]WLG97086.1 DNA-binding protein [Pseudomonas sp. FP198]